MVVKPSVRWKGLFEGEPFYKEMRAIIPELEKAGKKVIAVVGSDPPKFGHTNQSISDYLIEATKKGMHTYMGPRMNNLRTAIANFEKKYRNIKYSPEDILVAPGVAGCFNVLHYTLLDPGDEIVTIEPVHYVCAPSKYFSIFQSKLVTSSSNEEKEWNPDIDGLRASITDKTKGIVICHPVNPTGAVWNEKTLKSLVNIAGEREIPIISDEMYGLITFNGVKAKSIAEIADDVPTIVLGGMSKFFMRTGWRVGYLAFHDPLGKIEEVQETAIKVWGLYGHTRSSISTPILYAATKSFEGPMDTGWEFVKEMQANRDFAFKRLNKIEGVGCTKPKGTFYIFPHVDAIGKGKTWKTDMEFLLEFLKEEAATFMPGYRYGKSGFGHFRCHLLPDKEILEEIYERLEKFILRHTT